MDDLSKEVLNVICMSTRTRRPEGKLKSCDHLDSSKQVFSYLMDFLKCRSFFAFLVDII